MVDFLKNSNFLSSRIISGVELITGSETTFSYCQIKNYYGNISIKKEGSGIETIDALNQHIGKNKNIPFNATPPVCLTISGKQVLIKKVTIEQEATDATILQKALPGSNLHQFYFQKYWSNNHCWIAVIKKEILDEILQQLATSGFNCISVTLGPFPVLSLMEPQATLQLPNYTLTSDDNNVTISAQHNNVGMDLNLDGTSIPFQSITSFAGAFSYYSKNAQLEPIQHPLVDKTLQEVKFYIYQVALLRLFFVLVLFMALTNYFLNQSYQSAYSDLQEITSDQQAKYQLYEQKQGELNQRINILKTTGVSSYNNYAQYADQIAYLVPASVELLVLNIGVIEKKVKEGEQLNIDSHQIYIKGIAKESLALNEFILKLEQEEWVAESAILNYSKADREYPGLFEIKILLNE